MPVVLAIETDDEDENEDTQQENEEINEENISPKTLDPYEDELLLQYLRNGELTPGISQNQRKRVLKNSKYFTLEEGRLYYNDPDDETSKIKIVPRKEERNEIITNAHLLGHFDAIANNNIIIYHPSI